MSEATLQSKVISHAANNTGIDQRIVGNVVSLMSEGCTIPFIARYRKDNTGRLSDEDLRKLDEALKRAEALEKRREAVIDSLAQQNINNPELLRSIHKVSTMQGLEDLYRPYKQKKSSKASRAIKAGLGPLAMQIRIGKDGKNAQQLAKPFVKGDIESIEAAIEGAGDIIVEELATDPDLRQDLRKRLWGGQFEITAARGKKTELEQSTYRDLENTKRSLKSLRGHQVLAMDRAEREGLVSIKLLSHTPLERTVEAAILPKFKISTAATLKEFAARALKDRLYPAVERDIRSELTAEAHLSAIETFRTNLRQLLTQPPVHSKIILGVDPGYKNGCKCAVIDGQARLLKAFTILPHSGQRNRDQAEKTLVSIVKQFKVNILAIGNGSASRITVQFARDSLKAAGVKGVQIVVVNESGASIYSASKLAAEEHPDLDVMVRGALSICRRVLDPLAEFVKIEPRHLGIGQYQHDLNVKQLDEALTGIVEQVVNEVGVDLNSASSALLKYVSGIGPKLAQSIVDYRNAKQFDSRKELKKVKGLGPKAFQQAAGFLRVRESKEPLDHSGVHPENYKTAKAIAKQLKTPIKDLVGKASLLDSIDPENFISEKEGLAAIEDIIAELAAPGRDPRGEAKSMSYTEGLESIDDLKEGKVVNGTVTNLTDFGAFVDLGIGQNGLIHISKFGKRIKHPSDVVRLGEGISVKVIKVDKDRGRIGLEYIRSA